VKSRLRALGAACVLLLVVSGGAVAGRGYLERIDDGIARRRAANEALDHRLCEVAINMARADFRGLVAALAEVTPPPEDEAEAARQALTAAIVAQRYATIDCQRFVDDGTLVPVPAP
jgi:hypothetical protein